MNGATHDQSITKKEGWVFQKSKYGKYNKRFIQLTDNKIMCYKSIQFNKAKQRPTQTFDFSQHKYRVIAQEKDSQHFSLYNDTLSTSRSFKALTEFDQQTWVYAITQVLNILNKPSHIRVESELIYYKNPSELYDSDSDQNIDEFIHENSNRKRKMSQRKMNQIISASSFSNMRIRSLTVDPNLLPDFNDDDDDYDFKTFKDPGNALKLVPLKSGLEIDIFDKPRINSSSVFTVDGDDSLYDVMDDDEKKTEDESLYDVSMTDQLKVFGYKEKDIISAMKEVHNAQNIDQIRDKLDEKYEINRRTISDPMEDEKTRRKRFLEQEIIVSERAYCQGLNVLLNDLLQPMFDHGYIDMKYYKQIRSSIPMILDFHKDLLCHFEYFQDAETEEKAIINVFKDFMISNKENFIMISGSYISDYQSICGLFGCAFHGNKKLDNFLKSKRKEMKPLSSFLMLPVQRVPTYIHLLKQLRSNTDESNKDYNDIIDAVEIMESITNTINEKKEQIENYTQCLQIQEALNGLKESIVTANRRYIEQFIFIKKDVKHQRLFFLFSDIVIVANEKWKVKLVLDIRTLDVKVKREDNNMNLTVRKKPKQLPEFTLISSVAGRAVYIAKDIQTINKFEKKLGKCRVQLMSVDVRKRFNTLGDLKYELHRQAQLYD